MLRNRIRDLKRIFTFYCAANEGGDATTMDNTEYWKFVKDCKLQKDRKALPSVRVDLIFQQAIAQQVHSAAKAWAMANQASAVEAVGGGDDPSDKEAVDHGMGIREFVGALAKDKVVFQCVVFD